MWSARLLWEHNRVGAHHWIRRSPTLPSAPSASTKAELHSTPWGELYPAVGPAPHKIGEVREGGPSRRQPLPSAPVESCYGIDGPA